MGPTTAGYSGTILALGVPNPQGSWERKVSDCSYATPAVRCSRSNGRNDLPFNSRNILERIVSKHHKIALESLRPTARLYSLTNRPRKDSRELRVSGSGFAKKGGTANAG